MLPIFQVIVCFYGFLIMTHTDLNEMTLTVSFFNGAMAM